MPERILNPELYADRTVQDWHRAKFPKDWSAMDLDLAGVCGKCKHSLYLIEATTNPQKHTTYLRALAEDSDVPALLVFHKDKQVTSGRMVWPWVEAFRTEQDVIDFLTQLRSGHLCEYRRKKAVAS